MSVSKEHKDLSNKILEKRADATEGILSIIFSAVKKVTNQLRIVFK